MQPLPTPRGKTPRRQGKKQPKEGHPHREAGWRSSYLPPMIKTLLSCFFASALCLLPAGGHSWGFAAHRLINRCAVFLLPPAMIGFYKRHIDWLTDHAVDPDKRRYAIADEGPRHFLDLDRYGPPPHRQLPRDWKAAVQAFGEDSLKRYGILPWWVDRMQWRLTKAFQEMDTRSILQLSAEIGHYLSDGHVPLHACSNHNGQFTQQQGIHAFWESRIPERHGSQYDFVIPKAHYLTNPADYCWKRLFESAAAADSVLRIEKELSQSLPADSRYAYEPRNGIVIRQYAARYTDAYHQRLGGMVERRMRQSIHTVASFWYTAWVDAGQPRLDTFTANPFTTADRADWDSLDLRWRRDALRGRSCDAP